MKRLLIVAALIVLATALIACASPIARVPAPAPAPMPAPVPAPAPSPSTVIPGSSKEIPGEVVVETPPMAPEPSPVNGGDLSIDADRMIIRTANMQLVVDDVRDTIDKITDLAQDQQGYVVTGPKAIPSGRK